MKPATNIDSNAWYHLTEGRVDRPGRKFASMLLVDKATNSLQVFPVAHPPYYWQFQPVNSSASSSPALYVVRNSVDGTAKQLAACFDKSEPATGHTGLCMAPANGADAGQVWQLDQWGDGDLARDGLRFINVANGTGFWLDVHRGNPPFMNPTIDKDGDTGEPSQRWYMTSAQAVNAVEYSTVQSGVVIGTKATATTTTSTTASSKATASTTGSSDGTGGLSTGAQAGIGIGVALAVIALGLAALLLWRRRRKAARHSASVPDSPTTDATLPPAAGSEKKFHQAPGELPETAHHPPQELPTHMPQTQHYELDATPVPR